MKKFLQKSRIKAFFSALFLFGLFQPFLLSAQYYLGEGAALYNQASGAYITKTIDTPHDVFKDWAAAPDLWTKLKGNNYPATPPIISSPNQGNTYIEIAEGHKVELSSPLYFGNKLTLVVCGTLIIEQIAELPDVETIGAEYNAETSTVTFRGAVNFSDRLIKEVGFVIQYLPVGASVPLTRTVGVSVDNTDNLQVFDENDKEIGFSLSPDDFIMVSLTLTELNLLFGVSEITVGSAISFLAFAENILPLTGYGLQHNYSIGLAKSMLPDKDTGDDLNFVNSLTLIVCETGRLEMKSLNVKNNTIIEINGVFCVEEVSGFSTNTNCMYGNGSINTHSAGCTGAFTDSEISGFLFGNNCDQPSILDTTLPIELLTLSSEVKSDRVMLNWTTGTEINNDFFTIERSRDSYGWEVLGFVNGAGNSSTPKSYTFNDIHPLDGLAYYRLKQTDFDGRFKYYGPIAANYDFGLEGLEFKVMKQFSNWIIAVPNDGMYQVEVYNMQGHRLASEKVDNNLVIPAPEGAVVIRVTDEFARSASRVVM